MLSVLQKLLIFSFPEISSYFTPTMNSSTKIATSMSDVERAKLIKEMDDDLDHFIDSLARQVSSFIPGQTSGIANSRINLFF